MSVNTSAVHDPTLITHGAEAFGTQCIVVAMDVRRNFTPNEKAIPVYLEDGRTCWYEVVIYGGSKPTGIDAVAWAQEAEERGAGESVHIYRGHFYEAVPHVTYGTRSRSFRPGAITRQKGSSEVLGAIPPRRRPLPRPTPAAHSMKKATCRRVPRKRCSRQLRQS